MDTFKSFEEQLHSVNDRCFQDIAINLFRFQAQENSVYKSYLKHLKCEVHTVTEINQIPFLPISFFKNHLIKTASWNPEDYFTSSGTTGSITSSHAVKSVAFYHRHCKRCFEYFFGSVEQYHFLALLPSYLERKGSSLISMMNYFIESSGSPDSGFYLRDYDKLAGDILRLQNSDRKIILWGVTFALLDFGQKHGSVWDKGMIFETGGMKGRGKELTRQELHRQLSELYNVDKIYSEYGMTELFSQAYSLAGKEFMCPPWMKVLIRDLTDPFEMGITGNGAINVIDLANIHSIAFIETEDLGKVGKNGGYEVLGRMDNSDVRGCNLML